MSFASFLPFQSNFFVCARSMCSVAVFVWVTVVWLLETWAFLFVILRVSLVKIDKFCFRRLLARDRSIELYVGGLNCWNQCFSLSPYRLGFLHYCFVSKMWLSFEAQDLFLWEVPTSLGYIFFVAQPYGNWPSSSCQNVYLEGRDAPSLLLIIFMCFWDAI